MKSAIGDHAHAITETSRGDLPLAAVSFIAVDVETTGLNPRHDAIIEIGAVKVQQGTIVAEFDTLVTLDRTIPPEAQRVHGITNAMLVGKPSIREALDMLVRFSADGTLVEHSWKAFDVAFLEHANGGPVAATYLNTCTLSRRLFPFHRKHSLEECCRRHNIVNRQPHRALADARATAELLIYLLEAGGTRYPTLPELLQVAAVER